MPCVPPTPHPARPRGRTVRRLRRWTVLALAALPLLFAACTATDQSVEVRSNVARDTATGEEVQGAVASSNALASLLLQDLLTQGTDHNLVVSPPAVMASLAMLSLGSTGSSQDELLTLVSVEPAGQLAEQANVLWHLLGARSGEQRTAWRQGTVEADLATSLWLQSGIETDDEYLDLLGRYFGTGVRTVDFRSDPNAARQSMGTFVAASMPGASALLAEQAPISATTKLLALSSASVRAPWQVPFDPDRTDQARFQTTGGGAAEVPMMVYSSDHTVLIGSDEGWDVIDLPFLGAELSLLILAPRTGTWPGPLPSLDLARLQEVVQNLSMEQVDLRVPRFSVTSTLALDEVLRRQGAPRVLDPLEAQLDAMSPDESLSVSGVLHAARFSVDESGSDADAATVETSVVAGPAPQRIAIDRPFLFVVRDKPTGLIVLFGLVHDPSAG